jgi:hypothetical protein
MVSKGSTWQRPIILMVDTRRQLVGRIGATDSRRSLLNLFLWTSLFVFFGLSGRSTVQAADIQNAPVTSVGLTSQFAIADFDGDLRPDFASVQAEPSGSGGTTYWIQLQLSTFGRQSIRVVAPTGGLTIEARDINNGNHFIDLVLYTAWFKQPVAILLNDGHGRFSKVEPKAFPEAFNDPTSNGLSAPDQVTDVVGGLPLFRSIFCSEARNLLHRGLLAGLVSPSNDGFLVIPFLTSHAGRAPPSEVPHS